LHGCYVSGCLGVIKSRDVKVLAVLDYVFHGSCRKVSKVLSMGLEPISKSAIHYLARRVSEVRVSKEPRYRRCMAVDEAKLKKALKMCTNKPLVIVDKGPWYRWAFEAWTRA
jgi:hypothetical protein